MLERLERFGKQLGRDLARTWESLADGWRELLSRSANALTYFRRKDDGWSGTTEVIPADVPRWSLLAGDVADTGREIVVRLEMPGVDKADCEIFIEDDTLYVRGEKRFDSTYDDGVYYVRQCAYGAFERAVPLPRKVQGERADAKFRNGVLVVRLPTASGHEPRRIPVTVH